MSMALSSSENWRYWLRADSPAEKQDPHRPHFLMRHLTGREQRALAEKLDALEAHPQDAPTAAYVDLCFDAVRAAGIKAHFADNASTAQKIEPEGLQDIPGLGYREARELAYAAFAGGITAGDLGNSDSQLSTAGDSSASQASAKSA